MKRIILFIYTILLLLTHSSCCEDDDSSGSGQAQINPTIIKEYHTINYNGAIYEKYRFYDDGKLSQYHNQDYTLNYSYNSDNRIITILKNDLDNNTIENIEITYDNDGKVLTISDLEFEYHLGGNFYHTGEGYYNPLTTISDYNGDDIEAQTRTYTTYYDNNIDGIFERCDINDAELTNLTTGQYMGQDLETYCESSPFNFYWHDGDNLIASNEYDRRTFDTNTNPLYSETSNINYVISFINTDYNYGRIYPNIISKNNEIHLQADVDGPEETAYEYEFNTYNLPTNRYSQHYYTGDPEGLQYISAKYYYQGDTIPE